MANGLLKEIVYAEDEPDIKEIVKIALENLGGFNVKYCTNGTEVIDAIKQSKPDMVVLDVMMPQMDGPSTLQAIRKLPGFEHIPIVFITAKIQGNEVAQYKAMGATDVIGKPFDPMKLADSLKEIWQKHKATYNRKS